MASDLPNVILLVGDTVRARDIGTYGHVNTSPCIDELGESGVVFERGYTNAPWTLPAHASLFSGLLPSEHGCHGESPGFDPDRTMAELLSARGYETYGISNNIWLSRHFGFDAGFDEFVQNWKLFQDATELAYLIKPSIETSWRDFAREMVSGNVLKNVANSLYGKYVYRRDDYGGRRTTETATDLVESADAPFFLFCNYMEPHSEYRPNEFTGEFLPEDLSRRRLLEYSELSQRSPEYHFGDLTISDEEFQILRAMYDAEIKYFDREVGGVIEHLRRHDLLANSMVVVIGDHGENVGDHGLMEHKFSVHDTLLHVPVVVKYPAEYDVSGRESTPVDFRDLFREIVGVSDGEAPSLVGHERDAPIVAEYLSTAYVEEANDESSEFEGSEYDRLLSAVITGDHKYVTDDRGDRTLYRYDGSGTDMEKTEVEAPAIETELAEYATAFADVADAGGDTEIDGAVEQHLEDLGYM